MNRLKSLIIKLKNGIRINHKAKKNFEEYAYEQDGIDDWLARELQELLGTADWRNFLNGVDKAKES